MHPVLFRVGPFEAHSYFVLMYAGYLVGLGFARRTAPYFTAAAESEDGEALPGPAEAVSDTQGSGSARPFFRIGNRVTKRAISGAQVSEAAWSSLLPFVLGGRLMYCALNLPALRADPMEILRVWHGGFSLVGGVAGAALYAYTYCRRKGVSPAELTDAFAPGVTLGGAIGRLGCLLGGCCYGVPCDLPWAVSFGAHGQGGEWTPPCHPTQLYESLADLIILSVLCVYRPPRRLPGEIGLLWMILYAAARLLIEPFRSGATSPVLVAGLTFPQIVCFALLPIALWSLIRLRLPAGSRRAQNQAIAPPA